MNVLLLVIVGIASLIIAEQVATGWLVLGERINISRRDLNLLELVVIAGTFIWGLICLWTALRFLVHETKPLVRRYFDEGDPMPPGIQLSVALLVIIGIISSLVAVQVITGWLPLGERANIPRSNLNTIEWITIALSGIAAIITLRTVLGLIRRDHRAWAYAQWVLLLTAAMGGALLLWGIFRLSSITPVGGTYWQNPGGLQALTAPGMLLFLSSLVAYRYLAAELDTRFNRQKAVTGTLEDRARARETSRDTYPAIQAIRNRLSKSPGAGAIIAFIAIFTIASVSPASENFLTPAAQASWLTTNTINGVVAIGVTMLMISGEFDLSVGSMLGVSGLTFLGLITGQLPMTFIFIATLLIGGAAGITGWNNIRRGQRSLFSIISMIAGIGLLAACAWILFQALTGNLPQYLPPQPPVLAAILALIFTMSMGFLNGIILIRTGIPSFIVTLGTLLAFRAIPLLLVSDGRILRYADYFSTPPNIEVNRFLALVVVVVIAAFMVLMGRALLPNQWRSLWERIRTYRTDPNPFRDLSVVWNAVVFLFTSIALLMVLYLLVSVMADLLNREDSTLIVSFFDLMNGRIQSMPFIGALPLEVNMRMGVFWWFALVILFQFILTQTRYGNSTFAVGGNAGAARAQGINVNRIKVTNFVLLAMLVGIAAIFDVSRVQSVDALRGSGLELEVIAASVIGGALLTGGYGAVFGALLGVFIFGILQTILVLNSINPRVFNGVIGVILIVAVVINESISRRTK
ncbi:MAG: ABC transporter permease [Anaerolineae bacterium]|nr:ABC transporter permease [Anaerolineae bacterium]